MAAPSLEFDMKMVVMAAKRQDTWDAYFSQPRLLKYHSGATPQAIIKAMANG